MKIKAQNKVIVKDAQGDVVAEVGPRYRNVPVDSITHQRIEALCAARGLGMRGKGALVRILISREFAAAQKAGEINLLK